MDSLFKQYEGVFDEREALKNKNTGFEYAFSPFALQDAIGEKNIKKIWIEYQRLRLGGIEAEEIVHKIINKVRDVLAIKLGADKEDLNIKNDYPYQKSKKDAQNWNERDLNFFYTNLVGVYHLSRIESGSNLDVALEKLILSI